MNGFDHAISANETAMNSQGSALRENARYMESIEAKVNALDAAFEKLSTEVAPTSIIKVGLDALTWIFKELSTPLGSSITQFGLLSGTLLGLGTIALNVGGKIVGMIQALTGATTAATVMNPALLASSVALGAIATIAIKAYDAWTKYQQEQEEITKGAKQLKDAIDDSNKSYSESKTKIEATAEAAKGWMKRVEELTDKTSLNADEQYELNELVKRLNENIPNLGLEIDKVTGKIKGETTEIYNQIEAWKKLAIEQGLSDEISTRSSALGTAQIGRQEAILKRKDLVASLGGQSTYESIVGLMQKYESSKVVDTERVADFFGLEYSREAKKLGFKSASDMYDSTYEVIKQIQNLDKSISAYDKEIKDAEAGLRSIERTRDAMLGIDVRTQDQKEIAGTGEVAFGEELVSGASSTGRGKPNLDKVKETAKEQEEVEEVLEESFEEQYKALKHSLTMDYIAESEYYVSLEKLYKKFFEKGTEDYQKYEEEVYKGKKKLAEDFQKNKEKYDEDAAKAEAKAQEEAQKAYEQSLKDKEASEKAAKQAYEKAFNDQLDLLDHKLAMDEITEDEYYKSLDALNQKFFKNKEEYLDKYWKYEEKIYAYRKKLAEQEQKEQEKALEEFKKLQEERIKSLRDEVEAYNDLIKEQLDALKGTEDAINNKYDAEIAKIEETNKALEDQIEYEKLLEEMAKAKNTRKLVYTEEGYKYVEDTDAIASAQSKIDAYNKNKQIEAQKQALAWDRDLQLGAVADRRSALQAQQERWSNLSSLLGGVNSSMSDVDIIELMKSNSASWHETSNTDEQAKLHEANLILNELLSNKGSFSSSSGRWSMYADGTTSAMGGLSLVGERGAELRVLNHGDGIIPNGLTQNLMAWGKINPEAIMSNLGGMFGGGSTNINVSNITLPNVSNAQEFLSGLESLAKQYAFQRG